MAAIFWLAILSGIVGFTVFIASLFATDILVSFLERWKILQIEQTKRNELKLFALVSQLHTRQKDRYIFFTTRSQIVGIIAIFGVIISIASFFLLDASIELKKLAPFTIGIGRSLIVAYGEVLVSLGVFVSFLVTSIRLFKRLILIRAKLSNYEEYRRQVTKRWGREELSKIEAQLRT